MSETRYEYWADRNPYYRPGRKAIVGVVAAWLTYDLLTGYDTFLAGRSVDTPLHRHLFYYFGGEWGAAVVFGGLALYCVVSGVSQLKENLALVKLRRNA